MSEGGIFDLRPEAPAAPPSAPGGPRPAPAAGPPPAPTRAPGAWLRVWYVLGAVLCAVLLFALYNPSAWAQGAYGWPHEAFFDADGGWAWNWGRDPALVLVLAGASLTALVAGMLPAGAARGALGVLIGLVGVIGNAPRGENLPFFLLPVLACGAAAGMLMPRGRWRALTLGLSTVLLLAHFFLPWPQVQMDEAEIGLGYHSTALHLVGHYTDVDVTMRPDDTGNRPEAPSNWLEAYVRIFLVTQYSSLGLLILALALWAWLGWGGRRVGAVGAVLLTALVLGPLAAQFANGWRQADVEAIPMTGWEGGLKTLGEIFKASFLVYALPAAAGLVDLARRARVRATPGHAR